MLKKSLLTLSIIASLLLPTANVYAEDDTQTFVTGATSGSMGVEVTIEETYQIAIPAKLVLQYDNQTGNYIGTYTIGVKANLKNGEKVIVKPYGNSNNGQNLLLVPSNGYQIDGVSTIITQTINTWTPIPITDNEIACNSSQYIETQGTIVLPRANLKKAETYTGNLSFIFSKTDSE